MLLKPRNSLISQPNVFSCLVIGNFGLAKDELQGCGRQAPDAFSHSLPQIHRG